VQTMSGMTFLGMFAPKPLCESCLGRLTGYDVHTLRRPLRDLEVGHRVAIADAVCANCEETGPALRLLA
jgi:hypothetical protein